MALRERSDGQSIVGTDIVQGILAVNTKAGTASALILLQPDGTEKALWFQNDGKLYVGTRAQAAALSGGTVVGSQA